MQSWPCVRSHPVDDPQQSELPVEAVRRVDAARDRFEQAWKRGDRPRPEDYVGAVAGTERGVLVRELLALEVSYRRRHGPPPTAGEYLGRFPGDRAAVL